ARFGYTKENGNGIDGAVQSVQMFRMRHTLILPTHNAEHQDRFATRGFCAENCMLSPLLVSLTLILGQTDAAPTPLGDENYFLMRALAPTRIGSVLDTHAIKISGWTDLSFTAAST